MKPRQTTTGHLAASVTILIWGVTFISTKVLLRAFTPVEILFIRFVLGYIALWLFCPRRFSPKNWRLEWLFAAAGASGVALYYMLENIALTLTTASNVSIIIAISPFFTALLSRWVLRTEKPRAQFYIGFLAAVAGVAIISYSGNGTLQLNPTGDLLAVLAAAAWAVYSVLTKKIGELGWPTVQATRRVFFYGLVFMLPMLWFMGFQPDIAAMTAPVNLGNLLFLGFGASALCFVTWSTAVRQLGAVKTSVYIYLVPVVTVAASVLVLGEPLTPALAVGAALTLAGLWLSERRQRKGGDSQWTKKTPTA